MSTPIDYEKIKKAAQLSVEREFKIPEAGDEDRRYTGAEMAWLEFVSLATPAVVLELIGQYERLRAGVDSDMAEIDRIQAACDHHFRKARELRIERDQLKTEIKSLRNRLENKS